MDSARRRPTGLTLPLALALALARARALTLTLTLKPPTRALTRCLSFVGPPLQLPCVPEPTPEQVAEGHASTCSR